MPPHLGNGEKVHFWYGNTPDGNIITGGRKNLQLYMGCKPCCGPGIPSY